MAAIAARLQGPKNSGPALAGLSLLMISANLAARVFSSGQLFCDISAAQLFRALPFTSICEALICCIPAGARLAAWCPWVDLLATAARLLLNAF